MAKKKIEVAWSAAMREEAESDCRHMMAFFVSDGEIRARLKEAYGTPYGIATSCIKRVRTRLNEDLKNPLNTDRLLAENIQVTKSAIAIASQKKDLSALKYLIDHLSKITGIAAPKPTKDKPPEIPVDPFDDMTDEEILKATENG